MGDQFEIRPVHQHLVLGGILLTWSRGSPSYQPMPKAIDETAKRHNATDAQVALAG